MIFFNTFGEKITKFMYTNAFSNRQRLTLQCIGTQNGSPLDDVRHHDNQSVRDFVLVDQSKRIFYRDLVKKTFFLRSGAGLTLKV